jgi:anaerobic magnesium-protoporphyrin IX monomethyl ester cyclase
MIASTEILIGQSYHLRFDPKLWSEQKPYAPLGSLYAAACLLRDGYDVAFHDSMLATSTDEWEEALARYRPRIAVLFEDNFNYLTKMCLARMREAAFRMIASARVRGCRVVVCSSDATDYPDRYLEAGAHYVIRGEGEATLVELTGTLTGRTQTPAENIAGLALPGGDSPRFTPTRAVLRDLDALPSPAWHLVDVARYREIWKRRHGHFAMNLVTSRGCPFHCNWCAKPIWGQRYNVHSPGRVAREAAFLKQTYGAEYLWLMDDMVGIKPGWMRRYADALREADAVLPFKSLNRVDLLLRDGEIEALRDAGCDIVWSGAESGSQRVLDAMEKGIEVGQIRAATGRLHAAGIRVGFFLQFGYPGETLEDIAETFQLLRDCRPDEIGASVSYPLPGTRFYEAVRADLGRKQHWDDSDDLAMMYSGPFSTDFYRRLHRVLHKEFRLQKARRRLRGFIGQPFRTRPNLAREVAVMLYHGATLPLERRRLHRLAGVPDGTIGRPTRLLSRTDAATPSPQ